jgi:hypothetical protein
MVESARDAVKPGGRANKNYHAGLAGTSGNPPFIRSSVEEDADGTGRYGVYFGA